MTTPAGCSIVLNLTAQETEALDALCRQLGTLNRTQVVRSLIAAAAHLDGAACPASEWDTGGVRSATWQPSEPRPSSSA